MSERQLRVIVGCEFSATIRDAFRKLGHDAWSCDLLPCEGDPQWHHQGDIFDGVLTDQHWDIGIFHPPCTHLASSGARWFKEKQVEQKEAIAFFLAFTKLDNIKHTAIENPIGVMSSKYRKPDLIYQPWWFGHGETKATCLWLKNLPRLEKTKVAEGRVPKCWLESPGPDRGKRRSITPAGVAEAIATQWSAYVLKDQRE